MSIINIVDSFSNIAGVKSSEKANAQSSGPAVKDSALNERLTSSGKEKGVLFREEVDAVVSELNKMSSMLNNNIIRFTLDDRTNNIVVKVIDSETDEVVREIPTKHSRELLEHFREKLGVLLDKSI